MKAKRVRVCVVGSANMDLCFRLPRLPRAGETLPGTSFQDGLGGKGANQAVMAARLGADVSLVARVGDDDFGDAVRRNLEYEEVDSAHVVVDAYLSTGVAGIIVDDEARNCIMLIPGANAALTPADVEAAGSEIAAAGIVVCQLEVPLPTCQASLERGRAAGAKTILNLAPALPTPVELRAAADIIVLNETEIEDVSGGPLATQAEQVAAARKLIGHPAGTVLLTLGALGCLLVTGTDHELIPSIAVEAVDTTGAGDAFVGALAVFVTQGAKLRDAIRRANIVAALTVTREGTQSSYPTRGEAETFVQRHLN